MYTGYASQHTVWWLWSSSLCYVLLIVLPSFLNALDVCNLLMLYHKNQSFSELGLDAMCRQ